MPDRILLRDLVFYGYHGLHPEEQTLGQRFQVDLELRLDLRQAGRSDDLSETVDYGVAYGLIRSVVEGPSRRTIEAVAEACASALLERFAALELVRVRIGKPNAPIAGAQVGLVAVELERRRVAHDA